MSTKSNKNNKAKSKTVEKKVNPSVDFFSTKKPTTTKKSTSSSGDKASEFKRKGGTVKELVQEMDGDSATAAGKYHNSVTHSKSVLNEEVIGAGKPVTAESPPAVVLVVTEKPTTAKKAAVVATKPPAVVAAPVVAPAPVVVAAPVVAPAPVVVAAPVAPTPVVKLRGLSLR